MFALTFFVPSLTGAWHGRGPWRPCFFRRRRVATVRRQFLGGQHRCAAGLRCDDNGQRGFPAGQRGSATGQRGGAAGQRGVATRQKMLASSRSSGRDLTTISAPNHFSRRRSYGRFTQANRRTIQWPATHSEWPMANGVRLMAYGSHPTSRFPPPPVLSSRYEHRRPHRPLKTKGDSHAPPLSCLRWNDPVHHRHSDRTVMPRSRMPDVCHGSVAVRMQGVSNVDGRVKGRTGESPRVRAEFKAVAHGIRIDVSCQYWSHVCRTGCPPRQPAPMTDHRSLKTDN